MNKKNKDTNKKWRHCLVLSATYQGLKEGDWSFNSEVGHLALFNCEVMDSVSLVENQTVELHFLEDLNDSSKKKVIVDHLKLEPLSKEETLKILKKSGIKI